MTQTGLLIMLYTDKGLNGASTVTVLNGLSYDIAHQGRNRNFFLRGQSHFSWFFSRREIFFSPVENFPFGTPKTIICRFERWKKKKKKKGPLLILLIFGTFPPSILPFSFFSSSISSPPPFPFFPCLFFPDRSAEISRSEFSGGTLPPPPVTLLYSMPVWFLCSEMTELELCEIIILVKCL